MTSGSTLAVTMRAAWIDHLGTPEDIRYGRLPTPTPGPTDVLVNVDAVAVNPVDTFVRSGAYPTLTPFPFVIGRDLVGTVVATGSGATGFITGDRVWSNSLGHGGRQGAAAEYVVVPADRLYQLPEGVDPVTAVAVFHSAATAHLALTTHACLRAGEIAYIAGGGGHVGSAAIVLAAHAGAYVVTSASAGDLDYCRSLGADVALDYRDTNLLERLRTAAPSGVDVHIDTSGHQDLATAVDVLAARGRIVLMSGFTQRPALPVGACYTRDARLIGFAISNAAIPELADAASRVNRHLTDGTLRPRAVRELPLDAAAEAHRRLETGQARGTRLILRP